MLSLSFKLNSLLLYFLIGHHERYHSPRFGQTSPITVDYILFADVNIGGLSAIRPPSIYLLNISGFDQLRDRSLDCGYAALGICCDHLVGRIAVLVLSLPVAQVSVDTLRCKRQVISEDQFVIFHR